ncbi:MAG: hypothetical protein M1820_004227 [Bogoriella megaspora]|nr:MAG: hypothetical protein M1820_004227 [Bogoriella megaspora]
MLRIYFYNKFGNSEYSELVRKLVRAQHPIGSRDSEVHSIIRATGQFVEDIIARYFHDLSRHLPIISRTRFYNNLISLGAAPADDFSVLLLAICLITRTPALGYRPEDDSPRPAEQQSLYLNAKSLFAQIQVSCPPSITLVQAGLLLAVYEYTHSRPDDAFVTIAGVARLAYAAGIHTRQIPMTGAASRNIDTDSLLRAEEAANTWWGIIICEREVEVQSQPLLTTFPDSDARLPIEPRLLDRLDIESDALPNIALSCLTSPQLGGFSRFAQATSLLDQVFKAFSIPDTDSRLLLLDRLDTSLHSFLSLVMPQCPGQEGAFCASINTAIRALFILHSQILSLRPQTVRALFRPIDDWHKRASEALDTITKMVVDIGETLVADMSTVDGMPPMWPYVVRAALKHLSSSSGRENNGWMETAEEILKTSLSKYLRRWGISEE